MPIEWSLVSAADGKVQAEEIIRKLVRGDTYGRGRGQWTLTELFREKTAFAESARRIVAGVGQDGNVMGAGPLASADGSPMRFKLRVLSRQACTQAADGKGINNWDTTCTDPENDNNEYCPKIDDLPVEGDEVWIKGNPLTHDPQTGMRLIKKYKMAMKARLEEELGREIKPFLAHFYWTTAKVGADGCINVSYDHACQLLSTKGHRMVLPQFTAGRRNAKGTRKITNWLFEEVVPGDEPKKTRKPRTTKDNPPANA